MRVSMMIKLFGIIMIVMTTGILYSSIYQNEYQETQIRTAYGVSKGEIPCNCILDIADLRSGFELPKVELMQSPTEQPLDWAESKEIGMDGILVGNTYLGNYSAGDLVDLNTVKVSQNQLLGLEITDGTLPDIVRTEIINSTTSMNRTDLKIGEIIIDKKISESNLLFNKSIKEPTLDQNSFRVQVPPQGGDFVIIVSLLYNKPYNSSTFNTTTLTESNPVRLTGIYKGVISVAG
jgi:hypothetical protein